MKTLKFIIFSALYLSATYYLYTIGIASIGTIYTVVASVFFGLGIIVTVHIFTIIADRELKKSKERLEAKRKELYEKKQKIEEARKQLNDKLSFWAKRMDNKN